MKRIVLSFLILLVVVSACKEEKPKSPVVLSLSSFHELVHPAYLINPDSIRQYVRVNLSNANDTGLGLGYGELLCGRQCSIVLDERWRRAICRFTPLLVGEFSSAWIKPGTF